MLFERHKPPEKRMGRPCRWKAFHGFFWTWQYTGMRLPVQSIEMGRLLPQDTCQSLKNKGMSCHRCVGEARGNAASEVMEMISSRRARPYSENYSVYRHHERKLLRVVY